MKCIGLFINPKLYELRSSWQQSPLPMYRIPLHNSFANCSLTVLFYRRIRTLLSPFHIEQSFTNSDGVFITEPQSFVVTKKWLQSAVPRIKRGVQLIGLGTAKFKRDKRESISMLTLATVTARQTLAILKITLPR